MKNIFRLASWFIIAAGWIRAAEVPEWAYPVPPPAPPAVSPAPVDPSARHVPDSAVTFTAHDLAAHAGPVPDWHPEDHPAMPAIVAKGREPAVWACAYCHLPTGAGRPENASLAGLSAGYIKQQLAAFKAGDRPGSSPTRAPQNFMIALAKALTETEIDEAAAYFSALKPASFIKVVEVDTVPKTYVAGAMLGKIADGATEPIGHRLIEVPEELIRAENRDARTPYIAYVPVGSIAKGEVLVTATNGGQTLSCITCHGPGLKGLGDVPRLAGRSPSYLLRQLFDVQHGTRNGSSALMKPVVANLTTDDMIALVAYIASREP